MRCPPKVRQRGRRKLVTLMAIMEQADEEEPRSYSVDFKQEAVDRMAQATTIIGLAKELGIRRKLLCRWRDQFRTAAGPGWSDGEAGHREANHRSFPATLSTAELRIAELERLLGRKQLEVDFLRRASNKSGEQHRSYQRWRQGVYRSIEISLSFEGVGLTVEQQCRVAEVSRAGFYRYLQQTAPEQADLLLPARLQPLAVEHSSSASLPVINLRLSRVKVRSSAPSVYFA